jgi:oxygen-independent coproporphyrinogen-3 oxidase
LPINRALPINDHQRLIREMILLLKTGKIDAGYFRGKFGVEIGKEFGGAWASLIDEGFATVNGDDIRLTRKGLLQADTLLPRFFEPEHRGIRYT